MQELLFLFLPPMKTSWIMNLIMSGLFKEKWCVLYISVPAAASGIQINLYLWITGQAHFGVIHCALSPSAKAQATTCSLDFAVVCHLYYISSFSRFFSEKKLSINDTGEHGIFCLKKLQNGRTKKSWLAVADDKLKTPTLTSKDVRTSSEIAGFNLESLFHGKLIASRVLCSNI